MKRLWIALTFSVLAYSCGLFEGKAKVDNPVFSMQSGTYTNIQYIRCTTTTPYANIYYKLEIKKLKASQNGNIFETLQSDWLKQDAITLDRDYKVTAIATKYGLVDSDMVTAEYKIVRRITRNRNYLICQRVLSCKRSVETNYDFIVDATVTNIETRYRNTNSEWWWTNDVYYDGVTNSRDFSITNQKRFVYSSIEFSPLLLTRQLTGMISIQFDSENNAYVFGKFYSAQDFDPGPNYYCLIPSSTRGDFYIAKLDPDGNLRDLRVFMGNKLANDLHCSVASNGAVTIAGSYHGNFDSDPGPGDNTITTTGTNDIFIVQFDKDLNLQWTKTIGSVGNELIRELKKDGAGNIYICGTFNSPVDFDPDAGSEVRNNTGLKDIFVLKLNTDGNYQWVKTMGSAGNDSVSEMDVNRSGNILLIGSTNQALDFNMFNGVSANCETNLKNFSFLMKIGSDASVKWCFNNVNPSHIALDKDGNSYLAGSFIGNIDMNPGPGADVRSCSNTIYAYLTKLDTTGGYVRTLIFGGDVNVWNGNLEVDEAGNVFVNGTFAPYHGGVDFDPGPGVNLKVSVDPDDLYYYEMNDNGDQYPSENDSWIYGENFISKFKSDGSYLWTKVYNTYAMQNVNRTGNIEFDTYGNINVLGYNYRGDLFYGRIYKYASDNR